MSSVEFNKLEKDYETVISQQSSREVRKWRKEGKIDRSKRTYVATPEISSQNILAKNQVRPRVAYNYNFLAKDAHIGAGQNVAEFGVLPKKTKAAKSENTYEKRLARAMENMSVKGKKTKKPSKDEAESSDEEEEEEEEEEKENTENKEVPVKKVEESKIQEQKQEESKSSATQVRSRQGRKSVGSKPSSPAAPQLALDSKVIAQMKRLGAEVALVTESRSYAGRAQVLPKAVQEFLDAKWPKDKQYAYAGADDIVFTDFSEFVLSAEEMTTFQFIIDHPQDFILLADGDRVLATLQGDTSSDFQVYILNENAETVGPMRVSQFLKSLEAQDRDTSSMVNESQVEEDN